MNILILFGIPIVVFAIGFTMDRGRKINPWYIMEYVALAFPLVVSYAINGLYGLGMMGGTYLLALITLYMVAKLDWHATFVPTGEIKFITRGETLERVLENVEGYRVEYDATTREWKMEPGEKPDQYEPFITRWFGIYWVSLFFPLKRVHLYTFDWPRFFTGTKPSDEKGPVETVSEEGKYYLQHRHETVNSLYFRYAYPVVAVEVEIEGNFRITVTVLITTEVVYPARPVFLYKGNWLEPIMSAVRDAIAGFVNDMDINKVRMNIAKEETKHEFSRFILQAVNTEMVGMMVTKVDFVRYDLSERHAKEVAAITAKEVARLEADADAEKGRGEGDREQRRLEGRAKGLAAIGNAVGSDPVARAHVISAQMHQEAIEGFDGNVLSLGGAGTPVLVGADERPKGKGKDMEKVEEKE